MVPGLQVCPSVVAPHSGQRPSGASTPQDGQSTRGIYLPAGVRSCSVKRILPAGLPHAAVEKILEALDPDLAAHEDLHDAVITVPVGFAFALVGGADFARGTARGAGPGVDGTRHRGLPDIVTLRASLPRGISPVHAACTSDVRGL